jgi:hypothetical protein
MLYPGDVRYCYGSRPNNRPVVKAIVTSVAIASNVATLGITIAEGNIPAIGDLITVVNTATDSGAANVANVALTAVTISSLTGKGTVQYAATGSNQSTTPDIGMAYISPAEVAEALAVSKSKVYAIQNTIGRGYGITWGYNCPSAPSTIAIQLEGAINNNDNEFTIIGTSQTVTNAYTEIIAQIPNLVNFIRQHVTATTGGSSPSIVGKLLLS